MALFGRKRELEELQEKYQRLEEEYEALKNKQMSVEQMSLLELKNQLDSLTEMKAKEEKAVKDLEEEEESLKALQDELRKQIINDKEIVEMQTFGLYIPQYDFATSLAYKAELTRIRQEQKRMISDDIAIDYAYAMKFNNSEAQGRQFLKKQGKLMLRAFNGECEAAINKVTYKNLATIEKRITRSWEAINKLSHENICTITSQYYDLKIQELYLAYEYERKKEEEKEILREQREREREEKALQREVQAKKKVINKEIKHLEQVIQELELKLAEANNEDKESLSHQIDDLKDKLHIHEEEMEDLDYRLVYQSAGYVYIISNIGAFGEDVVKIGVTRRLDPKERIYELSSASVPFKFDVHALIFSEEAYQLEAALHERFDKYRVNKVNTRKEFFKVPPEKVKEALEEFKDLTIEFHEIPDADEYRETLKLIESENIG